MKKYVAAMVMLNLAAGCVYAKEAAKDANAAEVEAASSHNPFTRTTTNTYKEKRKRKLKTSHGADVVREDEVTVKEKLKDDGSKASVTVEETHSEEHEK